MQENKEIRELENFITIGGEIDKTSITLRFFGDELEPNEITEKLKCQPTEAHKKGDVVSSKHNPRIVKTGSWLLDRKKGNKQNLETQVQELFEELSEDINIWQDLTKRFEADIYCGAWLKAWNRDVYFSSDLLKKMADRGLDLGMAIYCEDDEEG